MLIIVIHILQQLPHLIHIWNMTIGILMNVVLVMNQIRILTVVIVITMIKKLVPQMERYELNFDLW